MEKNNDVADFFIIGAGPSGLFLAYTLALKYKDKSIIIADKGKSYFKRRCPLLCNSAMCSCKNCSIISGVGGAAFYVPAKLSYFPAGSKLQSLFKDESECNLYCDETIGIFKKFGINLTIPDGRTNFKEVTEAQQQAAENNIHLKYYHSQEFSKDDFTCFMKAMLNELADKHVKLLDEADVVDIERDNDEFIVDLSSQAYRCKKIIVATGESGSFWWNRMVHKLDMSCKKTSIDIGIRIEFQPNVIEKIYTCYKDPKFIFQATDGTELRSYCTLANGRTVVCKNGKFQVVDGIFCNYDNGVGAMTIFNRIYPQGESITFFAQRISENVYDKCNGKIAISKMGEFLGYPSCNNKIVHPNYIQQTNKFTQDFDLNTLVPQYILKNLRYGVRKLSSILPGLDYSENIVYFPAIDKLWEEISIDSKFQTSVENFFVIGDASGVARGIFQGALMGYICGSRI